MSSEDKLLNANDQISELKRWENLSFEEFQSPRVSFFGYLAFCSSLSESNTQGVSKSLHYFKSHCLKNQKVLFNEYEQFEFWTLSVSWDWFHNCSICAPPVPRQMSTGCAFSQLGDCVWAYSKAPNYLSLKMNCLIQCQKNTTKRNH